ncbi:uncharacterized protein [Lepeophtheirus salmonis]|uniref:uncharacterized protein isoform X5 n=1 Tax=Lepeophtheirus salmonis TaxID=72036 RepID=UPI003AF37424
MWLALILATIFFILYLIKEHSESERQVESDLVKSLDEEETNFLSLKLRHLSRQVCGRCGSGFSMLFNRRLQCSSCQLGVCKNCCKKLTSDGNWICDACTEQRELQRQSCEWFYDHLHKSFNDFGSAKIMKSISHNDHMNIVDENSSQVRDHIEKVVEALIGDNIDQVNINRLVNDPQYDGLFKNYHDKLSDALAGLVLAIQLVMENRTIEDENTTPTTAHIKLKNLINQLIIDAGKFKKGFMVTPETLHHSFRPQEEENSYEDLLATAIINKVVTSTRQKFRGQSNNNCIKNKRKSLSEEDMNGSSEESGRGASASPSSTPPVVLTSYYEEDSFSCGSCKYEDTLSNESEESPWIGDRGQGQKYTIQEEIEEVTTTVYDDDEITEKTIVRKNPKILSSVSCPTLNSLDSILLNECDSEFNVTYHHTNVPFPELGLDVTNVLNDPSSTQAHPKNNGWEENWLFKKQSHHPSNFVKLSALVRLLSDDPISMLVPNPNEDLRPQIGTRDVDEISELSERNSVGSIEFSTSSEEESESELDKTIKTKRSFKVSVSKTDVLKGTTTTLGSTAVLREGDVEYPQECDVEHTEFSVPAEVKKSFTDRGNVEFVTLPCVESSVTSGKILEIHCACSRSVDVAWFRNASPIHNDGLHYEIWRQKKSNSRVEHFLRIYDVRLEDQGDYRVVAYNDDGEKWHDFKVLVQEQSGQSSTPEIISYPDNSHLENEGLSKKFICQVKGHPEPRLVFLKDGKRLNRNENINIEYYNDFGEWSLEIRRLSHRDEGFYEVLAENRVGSCKRSWVLKVRQNPTPPDAKPPPIPSDLDEETKVETSLVNINERQKGSPSPVVVEAANHSVGLTLAEAINPSLVSSCSLVGNQVGERDMKFDKIEEEDSHYPSNPDSIASCSSNSTPPGSIADREHRKWVELAVNMPNNPYSKESIEKRQSLKSLGRNSDGSFMPKLTIDSIQEVQNADNAPSRIYCGLKSVDDSLYRRDYYINKNEEFNSPVHNTSFQKELEFEPINKEKDCLQVGSSLPPNNSLDCRLSQSSSKEDSSRSSFVDEKEDKYEEESEEAEMRSMKINMSELSNEFSSVCSLNEMQDSGMGSSCERSSLQLAGKVEAEILRFQMDIEKVNKEKSEMMDWQMKKIEKRRKCPPKEIGPPRRYYSSMDSLLSITEDSSNSSPDPPPPPSSNMPSFERSISDKTIKNLNKKQVSISENSTVIISCYEDDEDRFDDSAAILPSVKKLVTKFMPSESSESEVKPTIVKTERKSKNRFSCSNIRTSKEILTLTITSSTMDSTTKTMPHCPVKSKITLGEISVVHYESLDDEKEATSTTTHSTKTTTSIQQQQPFVSSVYLNCPDGYVRDASPTEDDEPYYYDVPSDLDKIRLINPKSKHSSVWSFVDVCLNNNNEKDVPKEEIETTQGSEEEDHRLYLCPILIDDNTHSDSISSCSTNYNNNHYYYYIPLKEETMSAVIGIHDFENEPIPTFKFKEPIHSLTARSVPRHFREGLKKGLTHFTDKNIKIPGSDSTIHSRNYGNSEEDYYDDDEESSHVIYDSKKKYQSSSVSSNNNTMESTRTPSPEHVGIPASRVRLTPKKRSDVTTTYCYTSDESTNNELYEHKTHHPPPSARRKQIIQQRLQNQI